MNTLSPTTIQIAKPAPMTVSEVQVPPKAYLNFQFSLQGASSAKQGDDLIIDMPDGSKVVCLGYYSNTTEGDRPQITVNGEALPPSALGIDFFSQQVEGLGQEDQPQNPEKGETEQKEQAGADAKAPASSGTTATGQSTASEQSSNVSSSSSSPSPSAGSSSASVNEGSFKQDMNVEFLGGIDRLPGLDLGSDRGFENTDIIGRGGPRGDALLGGTALPSTPPSNPSEPPSPPLDPSVPTPPVPPSVNVDVAGLREEGYDANKNPVGGNAADKSVSHSLIVTLPAGIDASSVKLYISMGNNALTALAPNTDFSASYGEFSYTVTNKLDANGNPLSPPQVEIRFTYKNLDNSHADINGLQLGEFIKDTLHYEVTVNGGAGSSDKGNVVQSGDAHFTIEGSNDGPSFRPVAGGTVIGHGEVKEEGVYNDNKNTAQGAWNTYDPGTDANDPAFGTHKNTTTIQLGVTDADKNDSHTFTLTNTTLKVISSDGVTWLNPTLEQNNDGSYTLKIDGVACGTLSLSPSGELIFTLDSTSPTIQGMKAGDNASFSFNVTVTDKGGLSDSGDVTLTIHGTNDRPTLDVVKNAGDSHITLTARGAEIAITESSHSSDMNSVSGSVQGADSDSGDSFTYHLVNKGTSVEGKDKLDSTDLDADGIIVGDYGTLVFQPDGTYTYTENGKLKGGESKSETFTVLVKDSNGAFTTKELTFTVKGTTDTNVSVDSQPPSVTVTEDGVQNGGNKPEDGRVAVRGDVTKDVANNPTFTDHGKDEGVTFSFKLSAKTGTDATITEDSIAQTQTLTTQYGTLVFNMADGTYTYTLHAGANKLGLNDRLVENFTVQIYKDGSLISGTLDLEVNIEGTNDKPILAVNTTGGVTVDAAGNGFATIIENSTGGEGESGNSVQGSVVGNDVDNGDTAGLTYHIAIQDLTGKDTLSAADLDADGTITGLYGTLVLDKATGTFTYTENGTLLPGQKFSETFTFVVKDAHGAFSTKDITFTVQGEYNDLVFFDASHDIKLQESGVQPGNTPFGGTSSATGNILWDASGNPTFTDSDGSFAREYTLVAGDDVDVISNTTTGSIQTLVTLYGTLTFNTTTGAYTYTLTDPNHADIHKLLSTEKLTEHFSLQVTKNGVIVGANLTVDVIIQGTNDMPTITVVDTGGGVNVDSTTGHGEAHLTESGRNAELNTDASDKHTSVSGKLAAGDADEGDSHTFHIVSKGKVLGNTLKNGDLDSDGKLEGDYGTLVLDKTTGTFTYTENGKLAANATGTDTFTVLVKDKDGAFVTKELTFNVTGQANKLEIAGDNYAIDLKESGVQYGGNTAENGKLEIIGNIATSPNNSPNIIDDDKDPSKWSFQLQVHDDDAGKGWTPSTSADGTTVTYTTAYGTLIFNTTTGDYTYTLNDGAANHLPQGSTIKEKFVVTISKAGQPDVEQDFVINIAGTNDIPVIAVDKSHFIITEDASITTPLAGQASNSDVDDGDTHSYSIMSGSSRVQVMSGAYGILRIDPNTGEYIYELDNSRDATQRLGQGQTGEESFTIRVTDNNGAFSEVEIKVTVNGALDTPTVSYAHGVVTEDGGLNADGDEIGTAGYTVEGSAHIGTVDSIHKNAGKYEVVDASGTVLGTVTGDMQTINTTNGTLVFNTTTGSYTYTMNAAANAAHQHLNIKDILALDGFIVRATFPNADGSNVVVNADLTIDIKGINDAPIFTNTAHFDTLSITRTHPLHEAPTEGNTATAKDVDNKDLGDAGITASTSELAFCFKVVMSGGKVEYVQSIKTAYGSVTINAQTGAYEYSLNNLHSDVRGLQAGYQLNDQFTIVVRDPHGAEDEQQVKVTINGIDDTAGPGGGHDLPDLDLVVKEDSGGITQRPGGDTINPGQEDSSGNGTSNPDAPRYAFKGTDGNISLSMQGKYGTVYIDAYTGKYRYVLDNQHSAVQMLAAGQFVNELFNVHSFKMNADGTITWLSSDGNPKGTIKVTVEGANDIPELNHENVASGIRVFGGATGLTTSGKFQHENIDIDTTDKPRFNLTADYAGEGATSVTQSYTWGMVTLNTLTGEYSYTLTSVVHTAVTEKFFVWVNDNNGGVVKEEVSISITPSNARPVIVSSLFTEGFEGDVSSSYTYGKDPNLGVNTSTGNITLDGIDLPDGATLGATLLETTTNLKGSFAAWDYEVDVSHTAASSAYKYFLCDADGTNLRALDSGDFGTLDLGLDGKFTFTLNNKNSVVMALKEGELKELNYHVVVRDANGVASGVEDFTITVVGTNNQPVITVDTPNITMNEDSVTSAVGNITLTDPDLDTSKIHDFALTGERAQSGGATSKLSIAESHNPTNNEYSFSVKDSSGMFGVFKVLVDPADPTKATYWFEVDPSVAGRLSATDNVTLEFKLTFDDGQMHNSTSAGVEINLTIQGKDGGGIVVSSLAPSDDFGDALPDAGTAGARTALRTGEGSNLVSDLAAPDAALPDTAPLPLVAQASASGAAAHRGIVSAPETGPTRSLTLESPLDSAPLPDMTSAPGQETLQFQLQTTGM